MVILLTRSRSDISAPIIKTVAVYVIDLNFRIKYAKYFTVHSQQPTSAAF